MLTDPEGNVVWTQYHWPGDVDAQFSQVIEDFRRDAGQLVEPVIQFLPYCLPQHIDALAVEVAELNSRHLDRLRTVMRVQRFDRSFKWKDDGTPYKEADKVEAVAHDFGVSPSTVKDDLMMVEHFGIPGLLKDDRPRSAILDDARERRLQSRATEQAVAVADTKECPDSPDGKHYWRWTVRECRICGEEETRKNTLTPTSPSSTINSHHSPS